MMKQILLVDDEPSILKLLNFLLSPDYDLVLKNSGVSAFDWLEEGNNPDLIISDLNMPHFDGAMFIHNLKISGYYRFTPIILLSGEAELGQVSNELSPNIDFVLQKPFNPDVLKQAIENILSTEFPYHEREINSEIEEMVAA